MKEVNYIQVFKFVTFIINMVKHSKMASLFIVNFTLTLTFLVKAGKSYAVLEYVSFSVFEFDAEIPYNNNGPFQNQSMKSPFLK